MAGRARSTAGWSVPLSVEAEPAFRTRHANPYNALLYEAVQGGGDVEVRELSVLRLAFGRARIVHLHWPDLTFLTARPSVVLVRLLLFYGALAVARLRGARLVWTAHNLQPHEVRSTPALRRLEAWLMARNLDAIIVLSASAESRLRAALPALAHVPVHVVLHGHYRDEYAFADTRADARARLGLPDHVPVLLAFGQIRGYKGVDRLIDVLVAVPDDVRLVIAGRAPADVVTDLEEAAARDPRLVLDLRFLPDDDLARLIRAADLVVLPYGAVENSGSAILALSGGRPVLAPRAGALGDLEDLVGPEWLRLYDGDLTPEHLAAALRAVPQAGDAPDLSPLNWPPIGRATEGVYRATIAARRPRRRGKQSER